MAALKSLHMLLAVLALASFSLRVLWRWRSPERLQQKWVRIFPHIIDGLLIAAGIALAVSYQLRPIDHPWLVAKLVAVVLYVFVSFYTLKRAASVLPGALAGWLIFAYIFYVAATKDAILF